MDVFLKNLQPQNPPGDETQVRIIHWGLQYIDSLQLCVNDWNCKCFQLLNFSCDYTQVPPSHGALQWPVSLEITTYHSIFKTYYSTPDKCMWRWQNPTSSILQISRAHCWVDNLVCVCVLGGGGVQWNVRLCSLCPVKWPKLSRENPHSETVLFTSAMCLIWVWVCVSWLLVWGN